MSTYEPNSAVVVLYDSKEYKAIDKKLNGTISSVCNLKITCIQKILAKWCYLFHLRST